MDFDVISFFYRVVVRQHVGQSLVCGWDYQDNRWERFLLRRFARFGFFFLAGDHLDYIHAIDLRVEHDHCESAVGVEAFAEFGGPANFVQHFLREERLALRADRFDETVYLVCEIRDVIDDDKTHTPCRDMLEYVSSRWETSGRGRFLSKGSRKSRQQHRYNQYITDTLGHNTLLKLSPRFNTTLSNHCTPAVTALSIITCSENCNNSLTEYVTRAPKPVRKNGKKLRNSRARRPWYVFDFLDIRVALYYLEGAIRFLAPVKPEPPGSGYPI